MIIGVSPTIRLRPCLLRGVNNVAVEAMFISHDLRASTPPPMLTDLSAQRCSQVMSPKQARGYLERAFEGDLAAAEEALKALAEAHPPSEIGSKAYRLYEQFRWGLDTMRDMSKPVLGNLKIKSEVL